MNTTEILSRQVGGDHYRTKAVQPTHFAMVNGWDPCAFAILKYVHRHPEKGGRTDLEKAVHMTQMRQHFTAQTCAHRLGFTVFLGRIVAFLGMSPLQQDDPRISMETYISMNRIEGQEAVALTLLDAWVRSPDPTKNARNALAVSKAINLIIEQTYGVAA